MKKLLIFTVVVIAALLARGAYNKVAAANETVNVCHATHSESNPWVAQHVNANQLQSHLDNGDFLYNGPIKSNGHPDQNGDTWCEDNAPGQPPTPPVTPTVTPPTTPPVTPQSVTPTTPSNQTNTDKKVTPPNGKLPATGSQQ